MLAGSCDTYTFLQTEAHQANECAHAGSSALASNDFATIIGGDNRLGGLNVAQDENNNRLRPVGPPSDLVAASRRYDLPNAPNTGIGFAPVNQGTPGTVAFASGTSSVDEGDGSAQIALTRTSGSNGPLSVRVDVTGGTATGGADYLIPGNRDVNWMSITGFNSIVNAMVMQPDRKVVAGGNFTSYNSITANRIARLNSDGTLDSSFVIGSGFDSPIRAMAIQPDGKILVGGGFTSYNGSAAIRIARLNSDGTFDTTFTTGSGFSNTVWSLAVQPDGRILVGGDFLTYNGSTVNRIVRLNSDGTHDTSFTSGTSFSNTVWTLALQPDGKILAGGLFTTYNGSTVNRIARLNSDGTRDSSFISGSGFNGNVYTLALQPDGKILVGGAFDTYNGGSVSRIARLNSDGSLDSTFTSGTGFDNAVNALARQPDGKILVGGLFTTYNGSIANRIVRLNSDGTLDTTFTSGTGFNESVNALALQPDGNIVVGGHFTNYNGRLIVRIARLQGDLIVNWAAGESGSKTIELPIEDDLLVEGDETVTLGLTALNGASLGAPNTHTLTIIDNDFAPTATPTPTSTSTATPTSTATNTPVPPTATPTSTSTSTSTATPTSTATNTPVPLTATPTSTSTATPTSTATNTPVPLTATPTATATATATSTPTQTPTSTATNTPVPPTATPTSTATSTPTSTSTATPTSTATNTPVPPSATATSTATATATSTPTQTPTSTATNTPVPLTATPTSTATATATQTATATSTPTSTATNTPVPPSATPTSTATATATSTPTQTPTSTATNTPVPPTATPTSTSTATPTSTATNTPVPPSATATSTATSTPTATATATATSTSTQTPTSTATAIATATSTPTATPIRPTSQRLFLPMMTGGGAPDLVASISISPDKRTFTAGEPVTILVTITNRGNLPAQPFWVDLSINPSSPPTAANQIWNTRCGLTPCFGMAWKVESALAPGQSITLSSQSLPAGYSNWLGRFATGTTDLYVYADSYNPDVVAGAVTESDETNNRAELRGLSVTGPNPAFMEVHPATDILSRPMR
jgi:uncharacterized delta-60 repeat protein